MKITVQSFGLTPHAPLEEHIEKSAFLPLYAITVNNQSLLCPPYMYNYIELFLQKYCEHIHNNV